jgi:hypothetical protein
MKIMKLQFLIPALITSSLFAQGPGGFGRYGRPNGNSNTSPTPPTPAQLAARQLQSVARFVGLDSAQTSALTGNTTLTGELTTEETTLQANAMTLKTDYSTLATQLISSPSAVPAELTTIEGLVSANLALRVTAAGQIIAALQALSPALSSPQTAQLPNLVQRLVGGGGAGIYGRH